jgi:hypothetical protein
MKLNPSQRTHIDAPLLSPNAVRRLTVGSVLASLHCSLRGASALQTASSRSDCCRREAYAGHTAFHGIAGLLNAIRMRASAGIPECVLVRLSAGERLTQFCCDRGVSFVADCAETRRWPRILRGDYRRIKNPLVAKENPNFDSRTLSRS